MSFQAYLDNVEKKTGLSPEQFIQIAKEKNLTAHKDLLEWLKNDYGLGVGHAKAVIYVIQHGGEFELRHTEGTHGDESGHLRLDGLKNRDKAT